MIRNLGGNLNTGQLHTLWTKAVGTKDYVKQEWRELAEMIEAGQLAREELDHANMDLDHRQELSDGDDEF